MVDKEPKIIYFLGPSKSGKTTSIERIIRTLNFEGIKCSTVKFIHHPTMNIDPAGKDSNRHRNAGALYSITFAPKETAIMISKQTRDTIDDAKNIIINSKSFLPMVDVIICESLNVPPAGSIVFLSVNTVEDIETYSKDLSECKIIGIVGNITNLIPRMINFKDIPIFSVLIAEDLDRLIAIIKKYVYKSN